MRDFDNMTGNHYRGIYRALVVNNIDPENGGRIQVRVYGLHSQDRNEVPNKSLPWALPAMAPMGGSSYVGMFSVPEIDSNVWVFFDGGNHNLPVYFANATDKLDWHLEANGQTTIISLGSDLSMKIINNAGAEVTIASDGTITINAINLNVFATGDINIEAGGNINETAGGTHTTRAGRIDHY